jgi:BirA family biotin operon repressor/biotin-[acetyl-CoA-carboxylase] ligase
MLRGGDFVSGAEIGRRLGVSRAMVGREVGGLVAAGCRIEAVTGRGYRLLALPDGPLPEVMAALWHGRFDYPVRFLSEVPSTMQLAGEWARAGAPPGATVATDHQTAGRGRRGRNWQDPPGEALLMSVVLRPRLEAAAAGWLPLAVAVGAARGVAEVTGAAPGIKWPNDLLLEGRKLAGILVELTLDEQDVRYAVAGLGVNVHQTGFPAEIAGRATSLRQAAGYQGTRAELMAALVPAVLGAVRELELDPLRLRDAWRAQSVTLGREVEIRTSQGGVRGLALDVDEIGRIVLEMPDGRRQAYAAGEISLDQHAAGSSGSTGRSSSTSR